MKHEHSRQRGKKFTARMFCYLPTIAARIANMKKPADIRHSPCLANDAYMGIAPVAWVSCHPASHFLRKHKADNNKLIGRGLIPTRIERLVGALILEPQEEQID